MNSAKNIVFVTRKFSFKNWGGMESFVLHNANALRKLGYFPKIYSTLAFSRKRTECIDGLEVRRFPYIYPNLNLNKSRTTQLDMKYGNPICPSLFINLIRERDLHLIHTLNYTSLGVIVRICSRLRKIPYVVSVYGGFGMRASEEREISTLERKTFNFLSRESYKVLRDSSAITTDNIDEYEYFKKEFPNKPIHLVHLGANFEKFQCGNPDAFRNKYDIRDENIVLNVARIDAQKNQIIIVKAAKEVLNVFPNTKFVFVGPISNQRYYEDLRSAILESGYKDKFLIIFGLKPETKELIDAYSACDVFIIADTFGGPVVVLYEIWAVGKPVISSRIPGDPGIISSGQDGLLFDSSSSSDLANKIIKLLANKGLTKRIGLAGKRNAKNNYTWNAVAKKLGEIYTDIM